jgi:ATP-binding cassette, subfamily B, heavy metal transporter
MYNIKYGRMEATDDEVYAAASAAQIKDFVESLPESWNTVVGERGVLIPVEFTYVNQ